MNSMQQEQSGFEIKSKVQHLIYVVVFGEIDPAFVSSRDSYRHIFLG